MPLIIPNKPRNSFVAYLENPTFCPYCEHREKPCTELNPKTKSRLKEQVTCENCKTTWTNLYTLTGVELPMGKEGSIVIQLKDKP